MEVERARLLNELVLRFKEKYDELGKDLETITKSNTNIT